MLAHAAAAAFAAAGVGTVCAAAVLDCSPGCCRRQQASTVAAALAHFAAAAYALAWSARPELLMCAVYAVAAAELLLVGLLQWVARGGCAAAAGWALAGAGLALPLAAITAGLCRRRN